MGVEPGARTIDHTERIPDQNPRQYFRRGPRPKQLGAGECLRGPYRRFRWLRRSGIWRRVSFGSRCPIAWRFRTIGGLDPLFLRRETGVAHEGIDALERGCLRAMLGLVQ